MMALMARGALARIALSRINNLMTIRKRLHSSASFTAASKQG